MFNYKIMKSGVWQSEFDVSCEVVSWSDSFLNLAVVPLCIWIRFLSWITHLSFQPEAQFPIRVRNKVPSNLNNDQGLAVYLSRSWNEYISQEL